MKSQLMPTVTTLLVPIPELYLHLIHKIEDQASITSDFNCDVVDNLIEMGSGQATCTTFNKDNPIG